MNYSLGNMLVNGGSLNPDGLALDLQFAVDKTLTARKGPTPVFTRASTATFIGSNGLIQSAAINTPRFDHDSTTLASRGLLIEESRTNLVLRSDDFPNASWGKINCSATSNAAVSPSGSSDADKMVENSLSALRVCQQIILTSASTIHTASVYAKASERNWIYIDPVHAGVANYRTYFDLSAGTVGNNAAGNTASITPVGNGWYRCVVTRATAAAQTSITLELGMANQNGGVAYLGDGTSGVFLWGAQLEVGSFPTSYIPTTAASVVRSADVCSITGGNFSGFYNQSEGTLLTSAFTPASGDRTVVATDDNTANEMVRLRTEGTNPFFRVTDGGVDVVAIDAGTISANTAFKLAGAYKLNDFASSVNGGSAVTDTSGAIPTVDRMRIGSGQAGNTMCGCISSIRYYKKRLADAKLQSLTT
jgi:hypothetical protein